MASMYDEQILKNIYGDAWTQKLYEQQFSTMPLVNNYNAREDVSRALNDLWNWLDAEGTRNPLCEIAGTISRLLFWKGSGEHLQWYYGDNYSVHDAGFELANRVYVGDVSVQVGMAEEYGYHADRKLTFNFGNWLPSLSKTDFFNFSPLATYFIDTLEDLFPSHTQLVVRYDPMGKGRAESVCLRNHQFELMWYQSVSRNSGDRGVLFEHHGNNEAVFTLSPTCDAKEKVILFTNRTIGIQKHIHRSKELTDVSMGDTFTEDEMLVLEMCGLDKYLWLHKPHFNKLLNLPTAYSYRKKAGLWQTQNRLIL